MTVPKDIAKKIVKLNVFEEETAQLSADSAGYAKIINDIEDGYNALNIFQRLKERVHHEKRMRRLCLYLESKMDKFKILERRRSELLYTIKAWFYRNDPENKRVDLTDFCIAEKPEGEYQGNGEFCLQYAGFNENEYIGTYFYPIDSSRCYVAVNYTCIGE